MDISRNIVTGVIAKGTLGKGFRQDDWINCLDADGSVKAGEQAYIDAYELGKLKTAKINQVTANRKDFIYSPIDYNNSTFINSEISGNNLQVAYQFSEESIEWLDIEGNTITLTKLQLGELIGLIMSKRSSGYFQEATLIKAIKACSTMDELELIVIEFV